MEAEWNSEISFHALCELSQDLFNKIDLFAITSDLEKLRKHLIGKITSLTSEIKTKPTIAEWEKLAEATLCRVVIFNKKDQTGMN
jgi:hypothetical protein